MNVTTARPPAAAFAIVRRPVAAPTANAMPPNERPSSASMTQAATMSASGTERSKSGPKRVIETAAMTASATAAPTIAIAFVASTCRRRTGVDSRRSRVPAFLFARDRSCARADREDQHDEGSHRVEELALEVADRRGVVLTCHDGADRVGQVLHVGLQVRSALLDARIERRVHQDHGGHADAPTDHASALIAHGFRQQAIHGIAPWPSSPGASLSGADPSSPK